MQGVCDYRLLPPCGALPLPCLTPPSSSPSSSNSCSSASAPSARARPALTSSSSRAGQSGAATCSAAHARGAARLFARAQVCPSWGDGGAGEHNHLGMPHPTPARKERRQIPALVLERRLCLLHRRDACPTCYPRAAAAPWFACCCAPSRRTRHARRPSRTAHQR